MSSIPLKLDIQGLRALAVLSVIIFHINKNWLPAGFIGVDIFFVISGFIISTIIINQKEKFNAIDFYKKRVIRIIPLYFFMLSTTSLFSLIFLKATDLKYYTDSLTSALTFTSNNYFSTFGNYFAPNSEELPLLHTWSLAIEMQFYFILPLIIILLPINKIKKILIISAISITLWSNYQISINQKDLYYSLIARIPEFLIGTIIALNSYNNIFRRFKYSALLGAFILIFSLYFVPIQGFPGVISLVPCIGVAMIIVQENSIINRILSHKVLVYIGGISYSLYLWHWPILSFFRYYTGENILSYSAIITAALLMIAISILTNHFIEKKLIKKSLKTIFLFILTNVLIIIFFIMSSDNINKKISPPDPIEFTRYENPKEICHSQIIPSCLDISNNKENILVIGDSHAGQLNLYFDFLSRNSHYNFNVISSSSCIPIHGFNVQQLPTWSQQPCKDQIIKVESELEKYNTIIIAGLWSKHFLDPTFKSVFNNFIKAHKNKKKHIVIMSQIPTFSQNIGRIIHFRNLGLHPYFQPNTETLIANHEMTQYSKYKNVDYADFSIAPIFAHAPFYKEIPIYFDSNHLNEVGIKLYVRDTGGSLIEIIEKSK